MKNKRIVVVRWLGQKEKRPQEGGVGPKILSSVGLTLVTIDIAALLVNRFVGTSHSIGR